MFYNCGNLNLPMHSEAAMKRSRLTVSVTAQFHGVESQLVDRPEIKEMVPAMDISVGHHYPIPAACSIRPGESSGTMR